MPTAARLPLALRALLLAGLITILALGLEPGTGQAPAIRLSGDDDGIARIATALTDSAPPAALFREAGAAPGELELQALADAAARAPLFVELPPTEGTVAGPRDLRVAAPARALTDRYAAVRFHARAAPGETFTAHLLDAGGVVVDSTRVGSDSSGAVAGAFRVRPGRTGWTEWRVRANGREAAAATWVAEAEAPRAMVVAGPPTWESRYAVRALERSGVRVSMVQALGRDNAIVTGDAPARWWADDALAGYDVVVLLPGANASAEAVADLDGWVAGGHGLLVATDAGGGAADSLRSAPGDSLHWSAPAEIVPLPAADVEAATSPLSTETGAMAGALVAARAPDGAPLFVVAPAAGGRVVRLGIRESWRWVLEAGHEAEHRAFWRSLVDWLAAPAADSLAVRVDPVEAPIGTTVEVGTRGPPLRLQRPDTEPSAVTGASAVNGADPWVGRFVVVDTGVHALWTGTGDGAGSGAAVAAVRSHPTEVTRAATLARARLSLLAAGSGGGALEPAAFEARAEALTRPPHRTGWRPWVFAALALLALAEWTLRRRRGLP